MSALWFLISSLFLPANPALLSGKITSREGDFLIGANVKLFKDRVLIKGVTADIDGKFQMEAEPGIYELEVSYTGFTTQRLTEIKLESGKTTELDIVLEGSMALSEVVVTDLKKSRKKDSDRAGALESRDEGRSAKAKTAAAKPVPPKAADIRREAPAPAVYAPAGEAKPAPSTAPAEAPIDDIVIVDGMKKRAVIAFDPETYEEKVILLDTEDGSAYTESEKELVEEKSSDPGTITQPAPRAGLLTAGEWNDLHNWNRHWADLLVDGEISSYEEMYGFFARQRFTVMLGNDAGIPLADVIVQLKNAGTIVWEAHTDNTGKAELWAGLYDNASFSNLTVEAWLNGKKYEFGKPKPAKEGYNFFRINVECYAPTNVDIVWAVDATGSMGDEIEYLKTEVLDVIARAKNSNPALSFRMGTAFYRDKGDEYVVKSSALSADINSTVQFIQKQFAGGGGDYPEAVHSALEEVVYGQNWSENAIARICFLVLDASPHQDPEVKASIQKSIREAAKRGIRIVPLAASGIQKDTEFLMKFFGLATNGTYLFLTDHSGIGGKHLEPTSDEYKVEPLNDLFVRIINEYTSIRTCEGKSNIRFENDPQQQPGVVLQASYFPNPAVDQFTLELPFEVQSVALYDSEGKGVYKLEKPLAGINIIPTRDLAAGFYTIRIMNNGRMQSGKLMVIRS